MEMYFVKKQERLNAEIKDLRNKLEKTSTESEKIDLKAMINSINRQNQENIKLASMILS